MKSGEQALIKKNPICKLFGHDYNCIENNDIESIFNTKYKCSRCGDEVFFIDEVRI